MPSEGKDFTSICEGLIWSQNTAALQEQPLIDPTSWAGAVQHDLVAFGAGATLQASTAPASIYLAAAVIMMVKDEADIIGENLTWLYTSGLRRFIILDNNSCDATVVIIERFRINNSDVELLILKDPLVRYMQAEKTTGLYRLALSIWPDLRWIIPVDADEFLIAERGLGALDEVDSSVDAVSISKAIHFRSLNTTSEDLTTMGRMAYRSPLFCVPPKIIARCNLFGTITQGNHKIRFVDDRVPIYSGGLRYGLYYREFPTRSFEHFVRKIHNGGEAIKAAEAFLGRKVGGEHWVNYHDALLRGGEKHLFAIYERDWVRDISNGFVVDPFVVDASLLHHGPEHENGS